MAEYTYTDADWRENAKYGLVGVTTDDAVEHWDRWLAAHDAKVRAEALREAYADLQAYTDSGAPFGHRPDEEFLLRRADRIEKETGL